MSAPVHDHSISDALVTVLSTYAFFLALLFLILYLAFFNWRKTRAGKAVAGIIASFVAIAAASFLFTVLGPDYFGRDVVRPLVWVLGAASFTSLLLSLVRSWLKGHPEPLVVEPRTETAGSPVQPTPPTPAEPPAE